MANSTNQGKTFPVECGADAPLTPQERPPSESLSCAWQSVLVVPRARPAWFAGTLVSSSGLRWYHGGVLAAALLLALHVQSATGCPAGPEVERQLGPLLADDVAAHDVATLAPAADGAVLLSLTDPSGQAVGARTLPAARTCDEQAKAIAVTLAVWEAQLHPEISLALDRLQPETPLPVEVPTVVRAATPPAAVPLAWTLGAAGAGDLQSGGWAPAALIELGLGRQGSRWRARVAVAGVGNHRMTLPPGTVSWRRGYLQLGAELDVAGTPRLALVLGAGALGGLTSISGAGFLADRSTLSFEWGGQARARFEVRLGGEGRVRPWVGVGVAMWARRQALDLEGGASAAALPRLEPMGTLGVDFVW